MKPQIGFTGCPPIITPRTGCHTDGHQLLAANGHRVGMWEGAHEEDAALHHLSALRCFFVVSVKGGVWYIQGWAWGTLRRDAVVLVGSC